MQNVVHFKVQRGITLDQAITRSEEEMRLRGFSRRTISTYLHALRQYFLFKHSDLSSMDEANIRMFLLRRESEKVSAQTRNLLLHAIKFFYREVIRTDRLIALRPAKEASALPVVLSRANAADHSRRARRRWCLPGHWQRAAFPFPRPFILCATVLPRTS